MIKLQPVSTFLGAIFFMIDAIFLSHFVDFNPVIQWSVIRFYHSLYFIFLLFISFLSQRVYAAQQCAESKLVKCVDASKRLGPLRNQDGTGWCYAFSAADIIGDRLAQKDPNYKIRKREDQVSAVAVALNFNRETRLSHFNEFEKKMELYGKLASDPDYKSRLEEKLKIQRANRDKKAKELVAAREELKDKFNVYLDTLHRCEQEGETAICPYMGKILKTKMRVENFLTNDMDYIDHEIAIAQTVSELDRIVDFQKQGGEKPHYGEEEGGHIVDALTGFNRGLCQERDIPSDDYQYAKEFKDLVNNSSSQRVEIFQKVVKMNKLLFANVKRMTSTIADSTVDPCLSATIGKMVFPNLDVTEIAQVLGRGLSEEYDPLDELYKTSCAKNSRLLNLGNVYHKAVYEVENSDEIFQDIDQSLDQGNIVGLEYYSEIFNFGGTQLTNEIEKSDSAHASVIVGKRFNCKSGEVEYKIRNSWGAESCDMDRQSYRSPAIENREKKNDIILEQCETECEKIPEDKSERYEQCLSDCSDKEMLAQEKLEKFIRQVIPFRCEEGHYIVPKSLLMKGVLGVAHY